MRVIPILAFVVLLAGCGSDVGTTDAGSGDGSSPGDANGGDAANVGDASSDGAGGDSGGGDAGQGASCNPKNDTCTRPLKCCPNGAAQSYSCQTTDTTGACIPKP